MKFTILICLIVFLGQLHAQSLFILKNECKTTTTLSDESNILSQQIEARHTSSLLEKKKVGLAILYSFILPGMGELYAGSYNSGKYFTAAEVALWLSYIGVDEYSKWQERNYKVYAGTRGDVNVQNPGDEYYSTIGNYRDIEQYNNAMSLERRFSKMLDAKKYYWSWNSTAERRSYRNMWVSSKEANNNLRFVVGAFIINRIVSVINAVRLTVANNRELEKSQTSMTFLADPNPQSLSNFTLIFKTAF